MVAISISMTRDTAGQRIYSLQANGGKTSSATELLGAMRDRPTLEKKYILRGTDTGMIIDAIRGLAASASRELLATLGREPQYDVNQVNGSPTDLGHE